MNELEEKVVALKFQNSDFKNGINDSLSELEKLKKGFEFDKAKKALSDIDVAAGKTDNLSKIGQAVENISSKFSALGAIGFSVLNNLTTRALNFGAAMINQVLDPILQGGRARALNIEQAKFQFKGLGISVEDAMANALEAVKGTAFGLDAAASAAGQLAASQIPLGTEMTNTLKAIAGVAAQTGSSYEDISRIFVGVAGNTRLMGDDLLQLSGRGINAAAVLAKSMGKSESDIRDMVSKGKISFAQFRDAMNDTFGANASKANETFTGALSNMKAAMSRIGAAFYTPNLEKGRDIYNALGPMFDKIGKALGPVVDHFAKFEKLSGQATVNFINGLNFDRIEQALNPLSGAALQVYNIVARLAKTVGEAFQEMFPQSAKNNLLTIGDAIKNFVFAISPTEHAIDNFRNALKGFFAILQLGWGVLRGVFTIIGKVFGAFSGADKVAANLGDLTGSFGEWLVSVRDFAAKGDRMQKFFEKIGDFIVKPIKALQDFSKTTADAGQNLTKNFSLAGIRDFFGSIGQWFVNAYKSIAGIDWSVPAAAFERFGKRFEGVGKIIGAVGDFFGGFGDKFAEVNKQVSDSSKAAGKNVNGFWDAIAEGLKNADFDLIFDAINTALLGGLVTSIAVFLAKAQAIFKDGILSAIFGKAAKSKDDTSFVDHFKEIFGGVTDALGAMQAQLKSKTLLNIAFAVAILAGALVVLSLIDSKKLTGALVAITVVFGELAGAMAVFTKVAGLGGIAQLPVLGAAMVIIAAAIVILASAVAKLGKLDWGELLRGLTGLAGIMVVMIAAAKGLAGEAKGMITAGVALVIFGAGVQIMADALIKLGKLNWEETIRGLILFAGVLAGVMIYLNHSMNDKQGLLAGLILLGVAQAILIFSKAIKSFAKMDVGGIVQGIVAVGVLLGLISGFTRTVGDVKGLITTGAGMIVVAYALQMLVKPVQKLSKIPLPQLATGVGAVAVMLGVLVGAAALTNPVQFLAFGAGMVIVAGAIVLLSKSIKSLGKMSWGEIGQAVGALGISLAILAAAMYVMEGTLPGAAALIVAAAALAILVPPLVALSKLTWGEIGAGVGALGIALAILAVAGIALIPAIPGLIGLGIAVGLLGAGVGLAAAGIGVLALGLAAIGTVGPLAAQGIALAVTTLLNLIPLALTKFGEGIVAFAAVIGENAPTFIEAFVSLINSLLDAINTVAPNIITTLLDLINQLLTAIDNNLPNFIDRGNSIVLKFLEGIASKQQAITEAGLEIVAATLRGIGNKVGDLVSAGTDIVIKTVQGIGNSSNRMVDAAGQTIVKFIDGLTSAVNRYSGEIREAGARLGFALADGMSGGLLSKATAVANKARDLALGALAAVQNAIDSHSPSKETYKLGSYFGDGFGNAIADSTKDVAKKASTMGTSAVMTLNRALDNIQDLSMSSMDTTPVIRPVLDLSGVQSQADKMKGIIGTARIAADVTATSASVAATGYQDNRQAEADAKEATPTVVNNDYKFEQTNNSPKALAAGEIYRNTRNQFAMAAEELDKE